MARRVYAIDDRSTLPARRRRREVSCLVAATAWM
jgi:hypothetical protein